MNFEGFQDLISRVVGEWYSSVKKGSTEEEMAMVDVYLSDSPFKAKQTKENELAYEKLMDTRMKLYELSYEIDRYHDSYMEFMEQSLESPDLMRRLVEDLTLEEKHLVHLELMIMEQVADWELDIGKVEASSTEWTKVKRYVVHLPNGSTRTLSISQQPERRYWFGMCAVTSKIGSVKLCAGCKVVGYIGKEEQKEDWPQHKKLCKVLQTARGKSDHWTCQTSGEKLLAMVEAGLGRKPTQFEHDIALHPRVCMVTGSGEGQNELRECRNCFCVAFSPNNYDEGIKLHKSEDCEALKTAAEDYKHEITLGHQVQNYSPKVLNKYQALPTDIEAFFREDVTGIVSNKLPGYQESELRYLTFLHSCSLTVLWALEQSGLRGGVRVEEAKELTLHLVGTRISEMRHLGGWEIIACRLPKLRRLRIVFVGLEAVTGDFPREFSYKGKDLQNERPEVEIKYHLEPPQTYQEFAKTKSYSAPDAVAALDCGFKFYPEWRPAIKEFLGNQDCPIIFTEFNQGDQEDNIALIESLGPVEVSVPARRNPFCSRRPVRCSDKSGNYNKYASVFYTNDYVAVVKPK